MVKFSEYYESIVSQRPEWRRAYINYHALNRLVCSVRDGGRPHEPSALRSRRRAARQALAGLVGGVEWVVHGVEAAVQKVISPSPFGATQRGAEDEGAGPIVVVSPPSGADFTDRTPLLGRPSPSGADNNSGASHRNVEDAYPYNRDAVDGREMATTTTTSYGSVSAHHFTNIANGSNALRERRRGGEQPQTRQPSGNPMSPSSSGGGAPSPLSPSPPSISLLTGTGGSGVGQAAAVAAPPLLSPPSDVVFVSRRDTMIYHQTEGGEGAGEGGGAGGVLTDGRRYLSPTYPSVVTTLGGGGGGDGMASSAASSVGDIDFGPGVDSGDSDDGYHNYDNHSTTTNPYGSLSSVRDRLLMAGGGDGGNNTNSINNNNTKGNSADAATGGRNNSPSSTSSGNNGSNTGGGGEVTAPFSGSPIPSAGLLPLEAAEAFERLLTIEADKCSRFAAEALRKYFRYFDDNVAKSRNKKGNERRVRSNIRYLFNELLQLIQFAETNLLIVKVLVRKYTRARPAGFMSQVLRGELPMLLRATEAEAEAAGNVVESLRTMMMGGVAAVPTKGGNSTNNNGPSGRASSRGSNAATGSSSDSSDTNDANSNRNGEGRRGATTTSRSGGRRRKTPRPQPFSVNNSTSDALGGGDTNTRRSTRKSRRGGRPRRGSAYADDNGDGVDAQTALAMQLESHVLYAGIGYDPSRPDHRFLLAGAGGDGGAPAASSRAASNSDVLLLASGSDFGGGGDRHPRLSSRDDVTTAPNGSDLHNMARSASGGAAHSSDDGGGNTAKSQKGGGGGKQYAGPAFRLTAYVRAKGSDKGKKLSEGELEAAREMAEEVLVERLKDTVAKVESLRAVVSSLWAELFTGGDMSRARDAIISGSKGTSPAQAFRVGVLAALILSCFLYWLHVLLELKPSRDVIDRFHLVFPVFRLLLAAPLVLIAWAGDLYVFKVMRINYLYMLELAPAHSVQWMQCLEFGLALLLILAIGTDVYVRSELHFDDGHYYSGDGFPVATPYVFPALIAIIGLSLAFPWRAVMWRSRDALARVLWHCIRLPLGFVTFVDFFVADWGTSLTQTFSDLTYTACYFTALPSRDYGGANSDVCFSTATRYGLVAALIPFYWRMCQTFLMYRRTKATVHLVNFGKYVTCVTYMLLAILHNNTAAAGGGGGGGGSPHNGSTGSGSFATRSLVGAVYTMRVVSQFYSFGWDVLMDWGWVKGKARSSMFSSNWPYVFATIYDFFARFFFVLVNAFLVGVLPRNYVQCLQLFVEVSRRALWSVFRIENENLNNLEMYRKIDFVPHVVAEEGD